MGLGKFTTHTGDFATFEQVYLDIHTQLMRYIKRIDEYSRKDFLESEKYKKKFIKDLLSPEDYLTPAEKRSLRTRLNYPNNPISINVVTFNYTHTFENLLGKEQRIGSIDPHPITANTEVLHIHREIGDNGIILGVYDVNQIANETLRNDADVQTLFVKPITNQALGVLYDARFKEYINNSNLICLFGTSLGATDNMWWKTIGNHLQQSSCQIIRFIHTDEKFQTDMHKIIFQNHKKDELLKTFGIDEKLWDSLCPRIYCVTHSEMFKNPEQQHGMEELYNRIFVKNNDTPRPLW